MEVQYNIVSADTRVLHSVTRKHYKNLVVRIAGYSAYFVEMNHDLQNDLISRTESYL